MNESPVVVRQTPGGASATALVGWEDHGGVARALLQAVLHAGRARVLLAELRDWPEHDLTSDVEAFANVAWDTLTAALRDPLDPDQVTWYLRHGQFSTYDVAGPDSVTRVDLFRQGDRWTRAGGWQAYHLLDDASASTALQGVDDVEVALGQVTGVQPE
jgi:hypothetical protein